MRGDTRYLVMRGDLGAAPRTGDLGAAPRRGELRPEVRRWRFIGSDSLVCAQNHPSTTQKALSPRHVFCPADQHRVPYFLVDSNCPADRRAQCVCVCLVLLCMLPRIWVYADVHPCTLKRHATRGSWCYRSRPFSSCPPSMRRIACSTTNFSEPRT
jgi:hypothetical protein